MGSNIMGIRAKAHYQGGKNTLGKKKTGGRGSGKPTVKHLDAACTGTVVEEAPGSFHCPKCGAWQFVGGKP